MPIELEFRSLVSKEQYDQLQTLLRANALDLGQDDKKIIFFIQPDKLLKVVDNKSKSSAKIALKLAKIGVSDAFPEIVIAISPREVTKAVDFFRSLGFTNVQESFQRRHNYRYNGVDIAIKHSPDWGYHVELEILMTDRSGLDQAERKIREVAAQLGLVLMTPRQLLELTAKIDARHAVSGVAQ